MFNLSVVDLMDYTAWERQKRYEWMRQQGDQVLTVSAGPNSNRFGTVGDLVKHIFSAEKRYVERLSGKSMTDTTSIPNDNLEALFQFGRESRNRLKEFVETFPPDKWDVPQEQNLVVAVITVTPRKSVTHILLHETRHWAQIGAMLRMAGHKGDFHDFLFCPAMGGIIRNEQGSTSGR
ncbi:MAG TPA: DinB family protein [Candidatus Acidoferrum sp.]|jgi:uncharacterized damage-inducible protein DinB|nr:DinB family protein [Candidatus Acidoferrum sp.]